MSIPATTIKIDCNDPIVKNEVKYFDTVVTYRIDTTLHPII